MVLMEGSSHHSWHHVNCLLPHRTGVHNIQSAGPLSSAQAWARARRDWEVGEGGRQWGRWQTLSWLEGTSGSGLTVDCTAAHNPQLAVGTLNLVQREHYAAILHLRKYHLCLCNQIWSPSLMILESSWKQSLSLLCFPVESNKGKIIWWKSFSKQH